MMNLRPSPPQTKRSKSTLERAMGVSGASGVLHARCNEGSTGDSFKTCGSSGAFSMPRDPFSRRDGVTPNVFAAPFRPAAPKDLRSAGLDFPARFHAGFFSGWSRRGILAGPKTEARPSSHAIFPKVGVSVLPDREFRAVEVSPWFKVAASLLPPH